MAEISFPAKIRTKDVTVFMDDDPSWGKMRSIFLKCQDKDGKFQPMTFFDEALPNFVTRIEGETFDVKNRALWIDLPGTELTFILGEVIAKLPLETYQKNLKLEGLSLLNMVP